jgi:hypothetical protein
MTRLRQAGLLSKAESRSRIHGPAGRTVAVHLFVIFVEQVAGAYEKIRIAIDIKARSQVQ